MITKQAANYNYLQQMSVMGHYVLCARDAKNIHKRSFGSISQKQIKLKANEVKSE